MSTKYTLAIGLVLALALFSILAISLNFTQDDAYISYRYVQNYLDGHGLVFNIGERVEGYTNFGWIIWLLLFGAIGLDYIVVSKITGFVCGALYILVTFLLGRRLFGRHGGLASATATILVGANLSLAYWSPAGLETAAFSLMVILSLYLFLNRNWLLIATLTAAVLLRPEGALVAGLLTAIEALVWRRIPKFTIIAAGVALIFSLPFVGFKLAYYGGILPNPFYAKTGFDTTQLVSGAEYVGRFMIHYGFCGIGLLLPLLFWRRLSTELRSVLAFTVLYTAYILIVGGDVLKVHRFFLPLLSGYAALVVAGIHHLTLRYVKARSHVALGLLGAILVSLTLWLPWDYVHTYNQTERDFVESMRRRAITMKDGDASDFSVALTTIGVFSYELIGHRIIDMLGLTDSTIARHPTTWDPDIKSTWKERGYNSQYVISQAPDYVMFSTKVKPSAPAEIDIMTYRSFLSHYRTVRWFDEGAGTPAVLFTTHKKIQTPPSPGRRNYPVQWVLFYRGAIEELNENRYRASLAFFDSAYHAAPGIDYPTLMYLKAVAHLRLGQVDFAENLMAAIIRFDSLVAGPHEYFYLKHSRMGDLQRAQVHKRWLLRLEPWYVARLDALAAEGMGR